MKLVYERTIRLIMLLLVYYLSYYVTDHYLFYTNYIIGGDFERYEYQNLEALIINSTITIVAALIWLRDS